jgi:activator of HSP90 ATPase
MADRIHQDVTFSSPPHAIYDALTSATAFAALSGSPAELDTSAGSSFSLFGGQILGRNVELIPGQRIVQAWRVAGWEPGLYSLVRFELTAEGSGTQLSFDHTGFPPESVAELDSGWHAMYWEPLKRHQREG